MLPPTNHALAHFSTSVSKTTKIAFSKGATMSTTSKPHSRKFPFTKRSIEALPRHDPESPSREAEYGDGEMIGLKLRVSKNGRRFFQHRYSYMGRKKCLSLGEFPHVSVQEARKRVSENKSLLSRDVDPSEERQQKRNDLTLTDYIDQFYIPHRGCPMASPMPGRWRPPIARLSSRSSFVECDAQTMEYFLEPGRR